MALRTLAILLCQIILSNWFQIPNYLLCQIILSNCFCFQIPNCLLCFLLCFLVQVVFQFYCLVPNSNFWLCFLLFSFIMALSILTLNCNRIRDQSKRTGLVQWLRFLPSVVDIVCLQDTHCVSQAKCTLWFSSSGFLSCLSTGSNHSCGCVILYHPMLSFVDLWAGSGGRYLQCEFSFCIKSFHVCCLYAPNLGRPISIGLALYPRCGQDCQLAGIALPAREPGRLP